jgi:cyclase
MISKRIISCLDVMNARVVKGVNFKDIKDMADPAELARRYYEGGADELVFYDITASIEERKLFPRVLRSVASEVFIPLTVGGGVSSLNDFDVLLNCGADKVSINNGAIKNPSLIREAAKRFGSQCVVLSMDVKRVKGKFHVFSHGGRTDTKIDAIEWAKRGEDLGAGEIVLNSIDTDGVQGGFDLPMLRAVGEILSIPLIASGGAGKKEDFLELFQQQI